jgi:hypothetical protein
LQLDKVMKVLRLRLYSLTAAIAAAQASIPIPQLGEIPQLGADLDGGGASHQFGISVALSADGSRMAVGSPGSNASGGAAFAGQVRVYAWSGGSWNQLGAAIDGEAAGDYSGISLSLSADGTRVAIASIFNQNSTGHVRVYEWDGSAWNQLGGDLDGVRTGDRFGEGLALSGDGTRVAIGAPLHDGIETRTGLVQVYEWNGSAWNQLGPDIPSNAFEQLGGALSLNADGTRLAVWARNNGGISDDAGQVRVYALNGSVWTLLGYDLDGATEDDNFGESVSLSGDGNRLAIGAPLNDTNGQSSGQVRVFAWDGSEWSAVGNPVNGASAGARAGSAVSISADGTRLAVGAPGSNGNGSLSGQVRLYGWDGTEWIQLVQAIDGEAELDESGSSVSLSADGSRLAIGAPFNDANGSNSGHVRVFGYNPPTAVASATLAEDIPGEATLDGTGSTDTDGSIASYTWTWPGGSAAGSVVTANFPVGQTEVTLTVTNTLGISATATVIVDTDSDIDGIDDAWERLYFGDLITANATSNADADFSSDLQEFVAGTNPNFGEVIPMGVDLDGEFNGDQSGRSVSISADGNRLAIGAPRNGNGSSAGHVRVFSWDGTGWSQLGDDIPGEFSLDEFGGAVSLNADGSRLAVGARFNDDNGFSSGHVRVYQWAAGAWSQLGNDLDGETLFDNFGRSVALNADGTRLAAGANFNDGNGDASGHVRVFVWDDGSGWSQLGADIDGEAVTDLSGTSVALSADGSLVAIGAPFNDGNGNRSGHVRVFAWNGSGWSQVGSDIDGEAAGDESGNSVALNADGTVLAIGAINNDGNGSDAGHVRVYAWTGSLWSQMGSAIDGATAGDQSGWSVALDSNGTRLAIGSPSNEAGHVRLYDWIDGEWRQYAGAIGGEAAGDESGRSVALSSDGNRLAIGAPLNDGNGSDSGHVRVFSLGDDDNDGLNDDWERKHFGDLSQFGFGDPDGDDLDNFSEQAFGTNPNDRDSDDDGLDDGAEVANGLDPLVAEQTANIAAVMAAYRTSLQRGYGEVLLGQPTIWSENGLLNLRIQLWSSDNLSDFSPLGAPVDFSAPVPVPGDVEIFRISAE